MGIINIDKIKLAKRESKFLEFKRKFEINNLGSVCETIKDIVAMANSGGGTIVFGLENNGKPSEEDLKDILKLDPAKLTDKIEKYTGVQFSNFEMLEDYKEGRKIAILNIGAGSSLLVFSRPGTYPLPQNQQKTAFSKGSIYFRHGAKSEPSNEKDINNFISKEIENRRKSWLGGIRKVFNAPAGHQVKILPKEIIESLEGGTTPIRIVSDLSAPAYRKLDPDITHPHRQKEAIFSINDKIKPKKINAYDILCIRKIHGLKNKSKFLHKSMFGPPQYSDQFVKWVIEKYAKNPLFFEESRKRFKFISQDFPKRSNKIHLLS